MTPVSALALEVLYPLATAANIAAHVGPLNAGMERYDIVTPERQAAFLAHVGVETMQLSALAENLNYSSPERVVAVFRKFDTNKDRVIEPEELELAKKYIHQPTALGNFVYANRNGNGDEASGDGYLYRARGDIGVTGKDNYVACSSSIYGDGYVLVKRPEMLEQPPGAALSAAWFWWAHGCNELADEGKFRETCLRINGGLNGFRERSETWTTGKTILV